MPKTRTVCYSVKWSKGRNGRQRLQDGKAETQEASESSSYISKLSRQMALAIYLEALIHRGEVASESELARLTGLDRSKISRLLMLRLLAPEIQEEILKGNCPAILRIKILLPIARERNWRKQETRYSDLAAGPSNPS